MPRKLTWIGAGLRASAEPIDPCVAHQIDKNVNAVGRDPAGQRWYGHAANLDKVVALPHDLLPKNAVVRRPEGIGEDLELRPIMLSKQAMNQMTDGMIVEIAGQVGDAESAGGGGPFSRREWLS